MEYFGIGCWLGVMLWFFTEGIRGCFYTYYCTLNMNYLYVRYIGSLVLAGAMGYYLATDIIIIDIQIRR